MATYTHPTISVVTTTKRSPGKSDTESLQILFPGTPAAIDFIGGDGAATYKKTALGLLLGNEITENLQIGTVDRDFGVNASDDARQPPVMSAVKTGGGGLPASPWVPNPTSPGDGSVDPKDQSAMPDGYGTSPTNSIANVGASSDTTQPTHDPSTSSQRMSQGREVGVYVMGKSPATSNAS